MGPLEFGDLAEEALLLIDSPPIIYVLKDHPRFGPRFAPLFAAHAAGRLRLAVTTIAVAEVLVGPLRAGDDVLAQRYQAILASWQRVALDLDIAASAARFTGFAPPGASRRRAGRDCVGDQCSGAGDA